jgi:hypothetical protein
MPSRILLSLLTLCLLAAAFAQERLTVDFTDVQTAVLDPVAWDTSLPNELYFDAIRPLLVRFPGSAEGIFGKLKDGYRLEKAELVLEWAKQEVENPERSRGNWGANELYAASPGQWHVLVRPLRKPWSTDDPQRGPTFNAYINGAGYWGLGGGRAAVDRGPDTFGPAPLYPAPKPPKPVVKEPGEDADIEPLPEDTTRIARLDVTKVLTDPAYGKDAGDRLRALEACGFQLYKQETRDMKYRSFWAYDWAVSIGYLKIWVKTPKLLVTLVKDANAAKPGALPPAVDIAALAAKGVVGAPTIAYPADLPQRAAKLLARPEGIPDWQWARIQELRALGTDPTDVILYLGRGYNFNTLFAGDQDAYLASMRELLRMPPRYWQGHQTSDFAILAYGYRDLLPPAVVDHLRLYWDSWLHPEAVNRGDIGGGNQRGGPSYFRGYSHGGGTMNFGHNATMGSFLAGQFLQAPNILKDSREGMENIARGGFGFGTGAHQEIGDTYYQALSVAAAGAVTKWAEDPVDRLRGRIWRDRLLEPLMSMYHPGLRRMTHPMGRGSYTYHILLQEGPYHILHTLSPSGTLMNLDGLKPVRKDTPATWGKVHGLSILGDEAPPLRIGLLAPWTEPYLADAYAAVVDGKTLPARIFALDYSPGCRGGGWHVNYLAQHYALASRDNANHDYGVTSAVAHWRRAATPVKNVDDLTTAILGFERNTRFMAQANSVAEFGIVQRDNKLIALKAIPARDRFEEKRTPVHALESTVAIISFGDVSGREVWVNDRKIAEVSGAKTDPGGDWQARLVAGMPLPTVVADDPEGTPETVAAPPENTPTKSVVAAKDGDIITIKDGVTYVGLIPLAVNPLERDRQVEISYEYPTLAVHAFIYRGGKPLNLDRYFNAEPKATAGFVVEMGDVTEYPTFEAFRKHMREVKLTVAWNAEKKYAEVNYASGKDTLEMAFDPGRYPAVARKVNGQWPYLPAGILRESSWAVQGSVGKLEKGGAVLETQPGHHAYLEAVPQADTYIAYNPLPDPMPWKLTLPGGMTVQANGKLGLARITARPKANRLYIDYAWKAGQQNADTPTALHVFGTANAPAVMVNDKPAAVQEVTVDGVKGYAVALP